MCKDALQFSPTAVICFSVHRSLVSFLSPSSQFVSPILVKPTGPSHSQGAVPQSMKQAERWKRLHTGSELTGNDSTSVFTGGDQTVDEYYANQKTGKKEWKVVYVEGVMHYMHAGAKPMVTLDENEPAFIPLNEEAPHPGNGIKRKMQVTWDGAAGRARRPIDNELFVCEACQQNFELASCLAFVDERRQLCNKPDPFLTKLLIENGMNTFSNQFKAARLVCVKCLQKLHAPDKDPNRVPYFSLEADGTLRTTSKWSNAMKATKRIKLRPRTLSIILKQIAAAAAKKNLDPVMFNATVLKAKYLELVKAGGKPASDWVGKLGDGCYILYYCVGCDTAPTSANQWYRCTTKPELSDVRSNSGPKGHWRCGICLTKYKAAVADKFCVFVVGTPRYHFVGFLGDTSNSIHNQIAYLKTLTLVRVIATSNGNVEVTNEVILAAIREFNAEAEFFLGSFPQVKKFISLNPNTVQNCYAYAEDPVLHIMSAAQTIRAFDLSEKPARTMQPKFTMQVLRAAFGCMDMGTEVQAKSLGPVHKKIRYEMLSDPVVINMQKRIRDLATHSRAGSSTDAAPPPQPPFPPQPDLPTPFPPQPDSLPVDHTHRVLRKHMEETSSDEDSRMVADIRKGLREYPERWLEDHSSGSLWRTTEQASTAERIIAVVEAHTNASTDPYPIPPPPADPLPPPEDVLTNDEQSSVYSEYENDVGSVDTDMMTDSGSYRHSEITFLERNFVAGTQINLNSRRLREVARSRRAASVRTTNQEARSRASDTGPVTDVTGRVLPETEVRM